MNRALFTPHEEDWFNNSRFEQFNLIDIFTYYDRVVKCPCFGMENIIPIIILSVAQ